MDPYRGSYGDWRDTVNEMVNVAGDKFYPDDPMESYWFRGEHGAEFTGSCGSAREQCDCSCYGCKHHCGACWRREIL